MRATIDHQGATIVHQGEALVHQGTRIDKITAEVGPLASAIDVYDGLFYGQSPDVPVVERLRELGQYYPFCPHCIGKHSSGEGHVHRPIPRKHGV